jgi:hypothetical protein
VPNSKVFMFLRSQLSLSVIIQFWIIFQVVLSKRAKALSVELAGQVTLSTQPPPLEFIVTLFQVLLTVVLAQAVIVSIGLLLI